MNCKAAFPTVLFLVFALLFFFASTAEAKRDKTGKKKKTELVSYEIEPDPIAAKSKPDHHPSAPDVPMLFAILGTDGAHTFGIDVSHYQGNIDWDVLATDSHASFVYLKATEGLDNVDNTYERNLAEAKRKGILVGTYHFFRGNVSAHNQFANFKRAFDPSKQDLLPVVDVEVMPKGMSKSRFDSCLEDLLAMIEDEYGRKPIIYTGKNFYNKHFYGTRFAHRYKFWIATYAPEQPVLDGNDDYLIWQYSAKGKVKGIKGFVDLNKFVGGHNINEIKYR